MHSLLANSTPRPRLASRPTPRAPACRAPLPCAFRPPPVRPRPLACCPACLPPYEPTPQRLPAPTHPCCVPRCVVGLARHYIAIQSSLALLSCRNTVRLYCNTNNPLLCNTIPPSLQYKPVYCNTKFSSPAFSCNALEPIAIQFYPAYCTLYCNTMQPLQYNFPLGCNTIQPLLAIQS